MPSPVARWLSTRSLRERYDDSVLPPPDHVINGRKFWALETIERHERRLVGRKPTVETTHRNLKAKRDPRFSGRRGPRH